MIDSGDRLVRLDEAFANPEPDGRTRPSSLVCDACRTPVLALPGAPMTWCAGCRRAFVAPGRRFLCQVPAHWSAPKFTRFWGRGVAARISDASDRSFVAYLGDRLDLGADDLDRLARTTEPRPILLGALAREHDLLAPAEVDWILELQRSTPARRRRSFGAIAVELGLWRPRLVPRLLAAQAERTRGAAAALFEHLELPAPDLVAAERAFFGLAGGSEPSARSPICAVLAEESVPA